MLRKTNLVEGETYHVFNRGANKNRIFTNKDDYRRFLMLLHLCNSSKPVLMREILTKYRGRSSADIFYEERPDKSLVSIIAYCLMPNHFHLVLRQKVKQGITKFMNRVGTAYSMYFNVKYEHSGVLFQGRYKSSHIGTESYFRYIFAYIHLNPVELVDPTWKESGIADPARVKSFINTYDFSSFKDYKKSERPERVILALKEKPDFLATQNDLEELLRSFAEDRPLQGLEAGVK